MQRLSMGLLSEMENDMDVAKTPTRSLRLHRETLSELSADEMASIKAGVILTPVIYTLPVEACVCTAGSGGDTEFCPSRTPNPM